MISQGPQHFPVYSHSNNSGRSLGLVKLKTMLKQYVNLKTICLR